ncbi:transcription factor E [Candidatus Alkanophaga liquidiphilum]|nr:Transcription initiation factor IIE [Candidatus Alkanophaga liquidiphilum]
MGVLSENSILEHSVVHEYLKKKVGEEGIVVIKSFLGKEETTDEEIAKITGLKLNIVRRILYILYESRIAEYKRLKDKESGWMTYLWSINPKNIEAAIENEAKRLIRNLEARLEFERENMFYVCSCGDTKVSFWQALEQNFKCGACGGALTYRDSSLIIKAIERRISEVEDP